MDNIELEIQNESIDLNVETPIIEVDLNGGTRGLKGDTGDRGEKGEKGNPGEKGEKGDSGVWVGEETPPDDYDVWIDPDGTPSTVPTKLSDLEDDSTHRTVTDVEKNNWNNKLSEVPNTYKTKNENDLLYQPKGEYITKSVNDLINYYLKSDTYTKSEVNSLISAIQVDLSNYYNKTQVDSLVEEAKDVVVITLSEDTTIDITSLRNKLLNTVDITTGKLEKIPILNMQYENSSDIINLYYELSDSTKKTLSGETVIDLETGEHVVVTDEVICFDYTSFQGVDVMVVRLYVSISNNKIYGFSDRWRLAYDDAIGSLYSLTTTDKTNLVSAINEVNAKLIDGDEVEY